MFELEQARAVLERTPATVRALLADLPEPWLAACEGPESWSPFEILGHMLHAEQEDWVPRMRILLEHGEARPFEPFDRFAHLQSDRGREVGELLDAFETWRRRNLDALAAADLGPEDLARTGRHPEFGQVTLAQLLATWVVHDLGHLRQMARVMAKRYATDVGPWEAYLPVLSEGAVAAD